MYPQDEPLDDADIERAFQADQRRLYRGGYVYPCPTCGEENAITAEMKRRGYHCDRCTRAIEEGW